MTEYYDCDIKAGFYSILGAPVAEHTFAIAEKDGVQYAFPCFGSFALKEGERGQTSVVYPADLWTPYMMFSQAKGRSLRANLYVAFGIARWTMQPAYDYRVQDWDNWWAQYPSLNGTSLACNAGLVYGVTGVCQQACNRILWSSQQGGFTYTPVNWPPSFSKSYWVWGYYGKLSEPAAISFATELVKQAKIQASQGMYGVSFDASDENTQVLEKISVNAQNDSMKQTRKALTAKTPAGGGRQRRQEVQGILEIAPGGKQVISSKKLSGVLSPDEKFQKLKTELDKQLLRAEISHDEYASRINSEFVQMLEEFRNVLPSETFNAMFGNDITGDIIVRDQMPESYEPFQEALRI